MSERRAVEGTCMNISQLEYLAVVVQYGSYAKAARALYVSTQAISKAISNLEQELNVELFIRSGKGVYPTDATLILAKKAREVIDNCNDIKSLADLLKLGEITTADITGSLSIAVPSSYCEGEVLPKKYLCDFQEKYPGVEFSYSYSSGGSCILSFLDGRVDAMITVGRFQSDDFLAVKVFDAELHAVISKNHPLSKKQTASLSDLSRYPIAKSYDLGLCHSIVDECLTARRLSVSYKEPLISMHEYDRFIHTDLGVVFVLRNETLEALYPDAVFLPLEKADIIRVPICIVAKRGDTLLTLFKQHILKAYHGV
jgi:DNA-binding transcriptional LysR family regulator